MLQTFFFFLLWETLTREQIIYNSMSTATLQVVIVTFSCSMMRIIWYLLAFLDNSCPPCDHSKHWWFPDNRCSMFDSPWLLDTVGPILLWYDVTRVQVGAQWHHPVINQLMNTGFPPSFHVIKKKLSFINGKTKIRYEVKSTCEQSCTYIYMWLW